MNHPFYLLERITLASRNQSESRTNIEMTCFAVRDMSSSHASTLPPIKHHYTKDLRGIICAPNL